MGVVQTRITSILVNIILNVRTPDQRDRVLLVDSDTGVHLGEEVSQVLDTCSVVSSGSITRVSVSVTTTGGDWHDRGGPADSVNQFLIGQTKCKLLSY